MNIVRVLGGLGNQMFQYAFYLSLREKGLDVLMDISDFTGYDLHNGFELEKIFNVKLDLASDRVLREFKNRRKNLIHKSIARIAGVHKRVLDEKDYSEANINPRKNYYYMGYWQSEDYFMNVQDKVRNAFRFQGALSDRNQEMLHTIKNTNSISIHVRRGDYINNPEVYKSLGSICNKQYFESAVEMVLQRVENPVFFIFSDDIQWVKENISINGPLHFINWNKQENSYLDMQLISECKHNIISNSSFSWWAAWLNQYSDKIVIAPAKWTHSEDPVKNRIPESWSTLCI